MILFDLGGTETVSANFTAPAQLSVFGMSPTTMTEKDGIVTDMQCGDTITFERLAYDGKYELNCRGIVEEGVKASAPLLDDCCCEVVLSACGNSIYIEETGIFRAVYHGDNRENIILMKD